MKKLFTKEDILSNKGCYSKEQVLNLSFINNSEISLVDIMNSEIPIKDKRWFLYNKSDLTLDQKKLLSLKLSWIVLPIYENKYPNDIRVRECLEYTEKFYKNEISVEELTEKRNADAAAAVYAAYAAVYAAYAADAAVYAAADKSYSQLLLEEIIKFIEAND